MDEANVIAHQISVLEGRLEELVQSDGETETDQGTDDAVVSILKETEGLTKRMMEALQADIMKQVDDETFRYARLLGVANLEALSFKPHRMDIKQGGTDLTFGKLNAGENLRMRVAASLATLKVARNRGFGRHPGLIVLDSPAASEMSAPDFSELVGAIGEIASEISGVQVIVGAVTRPELDAVIDSEHRKEAVGTEVLF